MLYTSLLWHTVAGMNKVCCWFLMSGNLLTSYPHFHEKKKKKDWTPAVCPNLPFFFFIFILSLSYCWPNGLPDGLFHRQLTKRPHCAQQITQDEAINPMLFNNMPILKLPQGGKNHLTVILLISFHFSENVAFHSDGKSLRCSPLCNRNLFAF